MRVEDQNVINAIVALIPDASVKLTPLDCSKQGYYIEVASASFAGQPLIEQHRRVKRALAKFLDSEDLHAITIKTKI